MMLYNVISQEINDLLDALFCLYPILCQSKEGFLLVTSMIKSIPETASFQYDFHTQYIDITIPFNNNYAYEVFLDNDYWYTSITHTGYVPFHSYFNQTGKNCLNNFDLGFSKYWMDFYLISYPEYNSKEDSWYFWSINDITLFDIRFYGYQFIDSKVNYLPNKYFKHWDYLSDAYMSTSLSWNPRRLEKNLDVNGLFFIWYEHFYNLDILLKCSFAYFTQITFPDLNAFDVGVQWGTSIFKYDSPYPARQWWLYHKIQDDIVDQVLNIDNIDWQRIYGPTYTPRGWSWWAIFSQGDSSNKWPYAKILIPIMENDPWIIQLYKETSAYNWIPLDNKIMQRNFLELFEFMQHAYTHVANFDYDNVVEINYNKYLFDGVKFDKITGEVAQREVDLV